MKCVVRASLYGQKSRWAVYSVDGLCPCLTASAGLGGGHVPMVDEKEVTE